MAQSFFTHVAPKLLESLSADQLPQWGTLTAVGMLDHLRRALAFSIGEERAEIVVPEEKLVVYKRFLMSDKPFGENLPQPKEFARVAAFEGDLEKHKAELLRQIEAVLHHFEVHPDFTSNHPSFGTLNKEEWMHLHKKHITHHFRQFGLL
jgi:hypothetical protein